MKKNDLTYFVIVLTFVLVSCQGKKEHKAVLPLEVPVASVIQQDVALESKYPGQTFGEADIEITARVEGLVQGLNFIQGSEVKMGQILYTIDPLPYLNKVDQANAKVTEANTMMVKAKADLDRIEPLASMGAVSQRELVGAKAQYEASVASLQAAEAAMRNSKIELGYCKITAPISGIIGISKVLTGDYVSKGPFNSINTISQTKNIHVRFTISEQEYLRLRRELTSENSSLRGTGKNIGMILSDGSLYPQTGQFSFTDRQIDPATGAMTLEASFSNPDKLLRPGQYVKVFFVSEFRKNALLIPQRAVAEMQGIFQVYVVNDSSKTVLKFVKPGPIYKDAYIIEEGLSVSQKVIVGGTQLLRPGMRVTQKDLAWKPGIKDESSK